MSQVSMYNDRCCLRMYVDTNFSVVCLPSYLPMSRHWGFACILRTRIQHLYGMVARDHTFIPKPITIGNKLKLTVQIIIIIRPSPSNILATYVK